MITSPFSVIRCPGHLASGESQDWTPSILILAHGGEVRAFIGDAVAESAFQRLNAGERARARVGYDLANRSASSPVTAPESHQRDAIGAR
jgi:hypothetical protein